MFVVISDSDGLMQVIKVTKNYEFALAYAYIYMNRIIQDMSDNGQTIVTPLTRTEGDTGYTFTFTPVGTQCRYNMYILRYDGRYGEEED